MTQPALVLVADDDDAMRKMLAASLRDRGLLVEECRDGTEVLGRLNHGAAGAREPDLLVCDVVMPGASGLEVLARVRDRVPALPMILITAFGDRHTHQRARQLGATLVLDKPFELEELYDHVVTLLALARSGPADPP